MQGEPFAAPRAERSAQPEAFAEGWERTNAVATKARSDPVWALWREAVMRGHGDQVRRTWSAPQSLSDLGFIQE